jgi:ribonucleoside-diphosphate reductase alpha chain
MSTMSMKVVKRNGTLEEVSFDKVLTRIQLAAKGLEVNPTLIAQRTLLRIYDGVKTSELDELAAQLSISLMTTNPDYGILASRIAISNHHRNTSDKFTDVVKELSHQVIEKTGEVVSNVSEELVRLCEEHGEVIDARIDYQRDYDLDYFGFKTLEKLQYLLRNTKGKTLERPQHLMMRVSLALWGTTNLERAFETYDLLSKKYFIHATPTNFNAGTPRQQLSSCFLLAMKGRDSIAGIYDTLKDCAMISKYAGGIGLHIHDIRAKGSLIRGTNGTSNGIVPMLRNFNDTARYVDQCFTPDTLVVTESGAQPIASILPGEKVLTSEGVFHTVLKQVIHEYSGRMFRIQLEGHPCPVQVTEEHPILSFPSDGQALAHCLEQIKAGVKEVDYREVKELQVGDYTVFPKGEHGLIQSIEPVEYTGRVHDFEIDGPHDYTVAHLGIAHNGGGKRNGSFAIYLEPWHADVEDFLKLKLNTGAEEERCRDLFYALWVPDLFMERVEKNEPWTLFCPSEAPGLSDVYGEEFRALYMKYEQEGRGRKQVDAQKLWFRILDSQIETGTPYLLYKDACNQKSNQKNLGTIKSSNLCVAPETLILTDKGQFPIHTLAGQEVRVWNGEKWSTTVVQKTGEGQRLVTVHLSNGAQITCTPYHKFLVQEGYTDKRSIKDAKRVEAWELTPGMTLPKFSLEVVHTDEKEDIPYPYTHGFFCGDGTYHKNPSGYISKGLSLYGEKKKLIPYLQIRTSTFVEDCIGRINTMLPDEIPEKYYVPMNASIQCKLQWLAGLLDSDGTVAKNGSNESLQIGSIHFEFLDRVRLMLQTLGAQTKVTLAHNERVSLMPDGKGGRKEYTSKACYRLLISSSSLYLLKVLGLTCYRLQFKGEQPQRNSEQLVKVVSVTDEGRTDDTYCFNEPENHAGVFNGILTGNCSEIIEYSSETEQSVCNLASIALPAYVNPKTRTFDFKKLRDVVAVAIRNLNRVIDINFYPTVETKTSNMRHRPVGLGVQGLADVFALLRVPWESDRAAELNQLIFEHIYFAAVEASCEIAQQEGPYSTFEGSPMSQGLFQYDLWKVTPLTSTEGLIQWHTVSEEKDQTLPWEELKERVKTHGVRNSLLVAPMPTASTSQILGYNECIEPITSNIYTRRTLAGEFIVINKHLMADLKKLDLWNEMMKQQIIARNGSVQGIDLIPESIQKLYKTSWEIKQKTLIDMAATRGAFICQSQSLNLFVADPNYAKLTSMHFYGWKRGLKTGLYYLRTRAPVMAQKFTIDPDLQKAAAKSEMERNMRRNQSGTEECLMCGS